MRRRALTAVLLASGLVVAMAGCGGASDTAGGGDTNSGGENIALVAYSTPQVVYDEIIPAFTATDAGKGTQVTTSYGPSGEQSRAVEAGLDADVVSSQSNRT